MKLSIGIVLIFISFTYFLSGAEADSERLIISMEIDDYKSYLKSNSPLDRLYVKDGRFYFLLNQKEMKKLQNIKVKSLVKSHPVTFPNNLNGTSSDVNGHYHNYAETEAFLFELAEQYPELATVFSVGQSIEGREIYVIKISDNVQAEEDEPNIFIVGCHHAREWISVEVPLLFAQHLLQQFSESNEVQKAVRGAQIYIMPIQNPDGLEYSIHHYRYWRKNRRYNGNFSWGVDNNRNYGYMWGYSDTGSSSNPNSEAFRGPLPFSEPETVAVRDFLLAHPPAGTLSYHNYGQSILFPWGYKEELSSDDFEMRAIAKKMTELIFQVNGRSYQYGTGPEILYPTNGGTIDWVYGTFRTPAYTIELPNDTYLLGGFFTSEEEIDLTFRDSLPSMLYFVNYFIDKNESVDQINKIEK